MPITIYTTPNCQGCKLTKMKLDSLGVAYTPVDLTEHPEEAARLSALGWRQAPIVEAGDDIWSGYRPDKCAGLVK